MPVATIAGADVAVDEEGDLGLGQHPAVTLLLDDLDGVHQASRLPHAAVSFDTLNLATRGDSFARNTQEIARK